MRGKGSSLKFLCCTLSQFLLLITTVTEFLKQANEGNLHVYSHIFQMMCKIQKCDKQSEPTGADKKRKR